MNTDVPLWAFLLTALVAVIGPFLSSVLSNRHALRLLKEQHAQEHRTWLRDRKYDAYTNALKVLGQARLKLRSDDPIDATSQVHEALAPIRAFASKDMGHTLVRLDTFAGRLAFSEDKKEFGMAYTSFSRALARLSAQIKQDLERVETSNQPVSSQNNIMQRLRFWRTTEAE